MTTYFKHIAQITARADHDKILRKALSTPAQEPFHCFDVFPFDKKEGTLLLVGEVSKSLIGDLKKLAPKAQYGAGLCTVTAQDEIIFEREAGKLQPRLVSAAVKLTGLKSTVKFNGETDEDGERPETENDEGQPEQKQATQAKAKPEVPPVNVKPPSDKPSSDKAAPPPSPRAKEFQDKLKVLRPAFDNALKKARTLKKELWAEDLESNFAQMVQEAKGGKFDAALQTLALLARLIKTEEASRAEVKHQASKEDAGYAEMNKSTVRENVAPQDFKDMRKVLKDTGYGVTGDGNVTYALPLKPGEWKTGVLGRIDALDQILSTSPVDYDAMEKTYVATLELVKRAEQHAFEGGDQDKARENAIWQVSSRLVDLNQEISKLAQRSPNYAPPSGPEILRRNEALRELIMDKFANPRATRPKEDEILAFKQKAEKDFDSRKRALNEQDREHEKAVAKLKDMAMALKDEAPELSKQEIDLRRKQLQQMQEVLQERSRELATASISITDEVEQFRKGIRNPERLNKLLKMLDKVKSLATREYFQQAHETIEDVLGLLSHDGFGHEDPAEEEILREFTILEDALRRQAMVESASPQKAARLLKRIKSDAQKAGALMD